MKPFRIPSLGTYPVLTEAFCEGRSSLDVLEAALRGGARIVQLREKNRPRRETLEMALRYREATTRHGALLIVNDFVDIALECAADGVHLGQGDIPCTEAKRMAPDLLVGVSTHDLEEALRAQEDGADYINIGPIFATRTKQNLVAPLGTDALKEIAARVSIPFTVMGGIKAHHIPELVAAGARLVAMVTEITRAPDVERTTRMLQKAVESALDGLPAV